MASNEIPKPREERLCGRGAFPLIPMEEFERLEYQKHRNRMLTHYPAVAAAGSLAEALTCAFAEIGSSLTADTHVPPIWEMTVPQFARVRQGSRVCYVRIGSFDVPLGSFGLRFFENEDGGYLGLFLSDVYQNGTAETPDLPTAANIIRDAMETGADLGEIARRFGVEFRPRPPLNIQISPGVKRFIQSFFNERDPRVAQDPAKLLDESKKAEDEE